MQILMSVLLIQMTVRSTLCVPTLPGAFCVTAEQAFKMLPEFAEVYYYTHLHTHTTLQVDGVFGRY